MKFLKYLMFSVLSISAVAGMIYLEQETSVVRSIKTTLGLEVAPVDPEAERGGMFAMAQIFFKGDDALPSLKALMSTRAAPPADRYLPEALPGWMREDRAVGVAEIAAFQASFFPGQTRAPSELEAEIEKATGMDMTAFAASQLEAGGLKIVGAYYYREDMQMLISISSLPKSMGFAASNLTAITNLDALEYQDDPNRVLEWHGELIPVSRDDATGYGALKLILGGAYMIGIQGNVPTDVMKAYLETISLPQTVGG